MFGNNTHKNNIETTLYFSMDSEHLFNFSDNRYDSFLQAGS